MDNFIGLPLADQFNAISIVIKLLPVLGLIVACIREIPTYRLWQKTRETIILSEAKHTLPSPEDTQIEHALRKKLLTDLIYIVATFCLSATMLLVGLYTIVILNSPRASDVWAILIGNSSSSEDNAKAHSMRLLNTNPPPTHGGRPICVKIAEDWPSDPNCAALAYLFTNGDCKIPTEFLPLNPDHPPIKEVTFDQFCSYLALWEQHQKNSPPMP